MSKRRKFSVEFKRGALEQANQPGVSCAQVARELGIRDNLLTRWKRKTLRAHRVLLSPACPKADPRHRQDRVDNSHLLANVADRPRPAGRRLRRFVR
jgi:transposase-like protein